MPLSVGDKLGPYEIVSPLGAGGMGEVWKARDTRLNRIVAIKTSKTEFSERFDREARAIAALNHPHICHLYDVGPDYLVMEFIEGTPLKGPLPLDQALHYAAQICDALDAAHRKGITHRDLKPSNILVTKGGVKLLDFGLAKVARSGQPEDDSTVTMTVTGKNQIVGTLYYMSPEQLQGQATNKEIDSRSDIFSFGLVLYEMLTGKRAIEGSSPARVIAAIMERPAPSVAQIAPTALDRLLQRCLKKDPDERWQTARDLKAELEWIQSETAVTPVLAPGAKRGARWLWPAVALASTILLAVVAWRLWSQPAPPARAIRFEVPLPDKVAFTGSVSVSPDGRKLAIHAGAGEQSGLWIRNLDSVEWRRLPDTQGGTFPFWSPDSRFLAFGLGNQLKKIGLAGGPPQTVCEMQGPVGGGAWNQDGTIIFSVGRGTGHLWRVSQAGGVATAITSVETAYERYHASPDFLPDGRHFLYLRGPGEGIYLSSLDAKPAEQSQQRLLDSTVFANYADGYLFFMRANTLIAQAFDTSKFQLKGEPVPIAERVTVTYSIVGAFSVSPSGVLAYHAGAAGPNVQLTWFDRQGKLQGTAGQPGPYQGLALSSDGKRVAGRSDIQQAPGDIWTLDLTSEASTPLTFRQGPGSFPVWSGDGSRIAFSAGRFVEDKDILFETLFEKASTGASEEKELYKNPGEWIVPTSWSRDGRFLLYTAVSMQNRGNDVWVLPLEGDRKPVLLLGTQSLESLGVFSPDGRWIAYVSNETSRNEVYVRPFVAQGPSGAPALGEGKWQISRNGGEQPHWRADGKEIFFERDGRLFAADVKTNGSALEQRLPQELFTKPNFGWDVTADGKRFLMAVPVQQSSAVPITVVLNWQADLKH